MALNQQTFFSMLEEKLISNQHLYSEIIDNNSEAIMREMNSMNASMDFGVITYVVDNKVSSISLTDTDILFDSETNVYVCEFKANVHSSGFMYIKETYPDINLNEDGNYGEVYMSNVTLFHQCVLNIAGDTAYESLLEIAFNNTLRFEEYDFAVSIPVYFRAMTLSEFNEERDYEEDPFSDIAVSLNSKASEDADSLKGNDSDERINLLVHYNENHYHFTEENEEEWQVENNVTFFDSSNDNDFKE